MDKREEEYFERLAKKRAVPAKALDGFATRGLKNALVEKYTDQAHFIYELLQNADDAKATAARFVLKKDSLIFAHNGTRPFSITDPAKEAEDHKNGSLGDINAITAIGMSSKKGLDEIGEPTIGKFGIGFKSVFQYTATPHIYDPNNIFFKIDFIALERLKEDHCERRGGETLFDFPFNHDKIKPEDAYYEISEKLCTLAYPLLFLSNLKDISFEVDGVDGLYGKAIEETLEFGDVTAEFIRLKQNDKTDPNEFYNETLWLFSRKDGEGNKYSVGFFVDKDGKLKSNDCNAFCFFLTKEFTGLNFIIHAPFLLTNSREGIQAGKQHNINMISLLSKLAADSFVFLKEIGEAKGVRLIDDDIIELIPYDESRFRGINTISFKPFYTEIKEAFKRDAIIPSSEGYAARSDAYWAEVMPTAELFSNEQLAVLTKNETAKWVFTSFGREDTSRSDNVLANYIGEITNSWLDEKSILNGITPKFIEAQPIEWLHRFYEWISKGDGRTELIKTKPIFLNQDSKASAAFDAKGDPILFLPTDGESDYPTLHKDLLENKDTAAFIKDKLGIKKPSLRDEIYKKILPLYKEDSAKIDTGAHFKKFFEYYQTCPQAEEVTSFIDELKDCSFVLYTTADNKTPLSGKAGDLYLPTYDIERWFKAKPETKFVFEKYFSWVGEEKKYKLHEFFIELGAKDMPRVIFHEINRKEVLKIKPRWDHFEHSKKCMDLYIDGCEELIEHIVKERNAGLSFFLWERLLARSYSTERDSFWARLQKLLGLDNLSLPFYIICEYSFRGQKFEKFDESTGAKLLRTKPWLINKNGEFVSAVEMPLQSLNLLYERNDALILLLEIGRDVKDDIRTFAKDYGMSEEDVRRLIIAEAERRKKAENRASISATDSIDRNIPSPTHAENRTASGNTSYDNDNDKDVAKRMIAAPQEPPQTTDEVSEDADEDDYIKPTVDSNKKIDKTIRQLEQKIREKSHRDNLKQKVQNFPTYSYAWFKTVLELEAMDSGEKSAGSREISISFFEVERDEHKTRKSTYLILKRPSRYIPQFMEDLDNIPLKLYFSDSSDPVSVEIEVMSVKSYTLEVILKSKVNIDALDLSQVKEARITAQNPVFLVKKLIEAFNELGYADDFDMKSNLRENIEFIFGPPGTGKTTYLAKNIIIPLMKEPKDLKVLVLAPTNKAADVLTHRLIESMGEDKSYKNWLIRFGTSSGGNIINEVFRDKTFDIKNSPRNVIVTTIARFAYDYFMPDGKTRHHLNALEWGYIVIDEASMISLPSIIYPLYKKTPEKFYIAGDPFQIEPITTVDELKDKNIYKMVELESFTNPATAPHNFPVTLLTTQYRSIPEIGAVFSRLTYGGVLQHFRSSDSRRTLPIGDILNLQPLTIIKFPVKKYESIYSPKRLKTNSNYQAYSALFAVEFAKYLYGLIEKAEGYEDFKIGLITPYRAQADLIDKLIEKAIPKEAAVEVGTIHSFQGDECDIIIALFNPPPTISNNENIFLNKQNIINVSISRAKDYLILLMPDDDTPNVENLKLIKKVEKLCKESPSCSEEITSDIEKELFRSKTYLEDNSFSTSHHLVNVYGRQEMLYEIRGSDDAVDVQIRVGGKIERETLFKDGRKEGIAKAYYESGKIKSETPYKNGKEDGIEKEYDESGKIEVEVSYIDGKKDGLEREYYEDGKIGYEATFKDGKEEGIARGYYENGNIERETPYKNGRKNGTENFYNENGKIREKIPYINDLKHGIASVYYENGKIKEEMPYKNGKKVGKAKEYYENGIIWREAPYKNGKKDGTVRYYYENGKIKRKLPYKNNELKGTVTWYYENGNGNKKWEAPFKGSKKEGTMWRYDENGRIRGMIGYKNGKKEGYARANHENGSTKVETFYKNGVKEGVEKEYYVGGLIFKGKIHIESPYKGGRKYGIERMYFENGKMKAEIPYIFGKEEGTAKQYHESGNIKEETPYKNGQKDGIEKAYYESGNIKEETPYKNGKADGIAKGYYESGKIMIETSYINGERVGLVREYDENGEIKREIYYEE